MPERPFTHYCWHCYSANSRPAGACGECGQAIGKPPATTYAQELIWALGHPLPQTQMIAAQILGDRRELAAERPLRSLVGHTDPFLAAQALQSLVAIVGVSACRDLLEPLAASGAPAVSRVAWRALYPGA